MEEHLLESEAGPASPPKPTSFLADFTFFYMWPVLLKGYQAAHLAACDLPALPPTDASNHALGAFLARGADASIGAPLATISRLYWRQFSYSGVMLALATAASLALPYSLHALLLALDDGGASSPLTRYGLAAAVTACTMVSALTLHRFWYDSQKIGYYAQLVLSATVLLKSLQLGASTRGAVSGSLVNNFAVDAARLSDTYVLPFLHWATWGALVPVVFSVYNLYALLGAAGLFGSAAAMLLIPSSALISRAVKASSERVQTHRDVRGRLIGEAITGVATLKAYDWMGRFLVLVSAARADEMAAMQRKQLLGVLADVLSASLTLVITAVALLSWAALHGPDERLSPAVAFASIVWISNLNQPLRSLPPFITSCIDVGISMRRLRELQALRDVDVTGLGEWVARIWSRRGEGGDSRHHHHHHLCVEGTGLEEEDTRLMMVESQSPSQDAEAAANEPLPMAGWYSPLDSGLVGTRHPAAEDDAAARSSSAVVCEDVSYRWGAPASLDDCTPAPPAAAVHRLSMTCPRGSLTMVVGPIGSGKSTLLCGLIGEAERCGGRALVRGRVAYCGQSPWILNRSIRDNVTVFGRSGSSDDYTCSMRGSSGVRRRDASGDDDAWLASVLDACALSEDIARMPRGLDTHVGDRGVTLSGGQKARLAVARAVYCGADVVLLDDPLSALDAFVAGHVWTHAILRLLLGRGRTVVICTHAVAYASLPCVHQVVGMVGGDVPVVGPYSTAAHELSRQNASLSSPLSPLEGAGGVDATEASALFVQEGESFVTAVAAAFGGTTASTPLTVPATSPLLVSVADVEAEVVEGEADGKGDPSSASDGSSSDDDKPTRPDDVEETSRSGGISGRTVWAYCRAMGVPILIALVVLYALTSALTLGSAYWLVVWTSQGGAAAPTHSAMWWAAGYGVILAALCAVNFARMVVLNGEGCSGGEISWAKINLVDLFLTTHPSHPIPPPY